MAWKMKDSGIEWIGEIPEGWEITKIKHIVSSVTDIDHFMPDSAEFGIPYLMIGDLKDLSSSIDWDSSKKISKYSLQGTTQGRYLTGGVPPVRFSM